MSPKHGHARGRGTSTYRSWQGMRSRCINPNHHAFARYGGRGIVVCERWLGEHGFENFLADMGPRPLGTSLDRFPDNDGNYDPENCRWATRIEQENNKSSSRRLTFRGETLTMTQWSRRVGLPKTLLRQRLESGWSVERALLAPVETNMRNVSPRGRSGVRGAAWASGRRKWLAAIRIHGVKTFLGYFDTAEEAGQAYAQARARIEVAA